MQNEHNSPDCSGSGRWLGDWISHYEGRRGRDKNSHKSTNFLTVLRSEYISMSKRPQVGKMAAATVGGSLILLQIAHHKGYIKVDWNKVRPDSHWTVPMFNLNCDLFNVMVFCLMLLKFHSDGSENNFLRNPIKYRDLHVYRPSEERLTAELDYHTVDVWLVSFP